MTCRNCGTEIAANALICYKCGTATTEPRIKPPAPKRGMSAATIAGLVVLALALAALVRVTACGSLL
jgi:zinc ribbon protein